MKPGNINQDVNEAARKAVVDAGFKGYDYLGLLGHSLGTTGLHVSYCGGVRLEDTILITEDGNEFFYNSTLR